MQDKIALSLRTSPKLLGLYNKAAEFQPTVSRADITAQAIEYGLSAEPNWKEVAFAAEKASYPVTSDSAAAFIQLRVDKEMWSKLVSAISNSFTPPLKRTTTPYVIKLVIYNYVQYLTDLNADSPHAKQNILTAPEMAAVLTEMLMMENRPAELDEIEAIMASWKKLV